MSKCFVLLIIGSVGVVEGVVRRRDDGFGLSLFASAGC